MYIPDFLVEICTIDLQYTCFTVVDYLLANDFAYGEANSHSPNITSHCPILYFSLKCMPVGEEVDFTDFGYQNTLPLHARSTASQVSPSGNLNVSLQLIW